MIVIILKNSLEEQQLDKMAFLHLPKKNRRFTAVVVMALLQMKLLLVLVEIFDCRHLPPRRYYSLACKLDWLGCMLALLLPHCLVYKLHLYC